MAGKVECANLCIQLFVAGEIESHIHCMAIILLSPITFTQFATAIWFSYVTLNFLFENRNNQSLIFKVLNFLTLLPEIANDEAGLFGPINFKPLF